MKESWFCLKEKTTAQHWFSYFQIAGNSNNILGLTL